MNSSELKKRAVSVHNALYIDDSGEDLMFMYVLFVCLGMFFGLVPLELIGLGKGLPYAVEQCTGQWGATFQAFVEAHGWILYRGGLTGWYGTICGVTCNLWFMSLVMYLCLRVPIVLRSQNMAKHQSKLSIHYFGTTFLGTIRGKKVNLTGILGVRGSELNSGKVKPVVSVSGKTLAVHYEAVEQLELDSAEALKLLDEWTERGQQLVAKAPGKWRRRLAFISPFILPVAYYLWLTYIYIVHC